MKIITGSIRMPTGSIRIPDGMKSGSPPESAAGISPDSGEPPDARNHQMPTENTIYKNKKKIIIIS